MKKQRLRGVWGLGRSTRHLPQVHTLLLCSRKPRTSWPIHIAPASITSLSTQSHLLNLYHVWACCKLQAWIQTTDGRAAAAALSTVCEISRLIILMITWWKSRLKDRVSASNRLGDGNEYRSEQRQYEQRTLQTLGRTFKMQIRKCVHTWAQNSLCVRKCFVYF